MLDTVVMAVRRVHHKIITTILCSPKVTVRIDNRIPIKLTNTHHHLITIIICPPKSAMRKKNSPVASAIVCSVVNTIHKDYRVVMFFSQSVTMGIKLAVMVQRIPTVRPSVKVQLVIKTLAVQIGRVYVVTPAMTKEISIVTARIQPVIIQPKTIIIPCMVVKFVGNRVSAVVSCFAG